MPEKVITEAEDQMMKRGALFGAFSVIALVLFNVPLRKLFSLSIEDELYSYIPFIPLVSLCLIVIHSKRIFSNTYYSFKLSFPLLLIALLIFLLGSNHGRAYRTNDHLAIMMFGFFLWVLSSFMLCFGRQAFKESVFPLTFLIFLVPVPAFLLDPYISFLQTGSSETAHVIFKWLGLPIYREGFIFSLPGLSVEVTEQCSGVRSSLALLITCLIAGKLFLETNWRRLILVFCVFPIAIIKNGLRIVTLSLLGAYVNPGFVDGYWLHRNGGIPFFFVALLLVVPVVWLLRKWERKGRSKLKRKSWDAGR